MKPETCNSIGRTDMILRVDKACTKNCDGPSSPMIVASTDDTDPAIKALLIEGYRRMSPSQKMERVRALTRAVQELALADIRRRHPDADDRERALRLASRWIEPDLMVRAFAWDVRKVGYWCCPSHCSSSRAWFGGIGHTPPQRPARPSLWPSRMAEKNREAPGP
jgi:hypothetical protein